MRVRAALLIVACALVVASCRSTATTTEAGPPEARPGAEPMAVADSGTLAQEAEPDENGVEAGPRDHMFLETDGVSKDVWATGWASIPHPSVPEYAFAGPLGCARQRFKTKLTRNIRLDIGYTARKAFVIVAEEPYVLAKPPVVEGKTLVWSGDFRHADGRTRRFRLRIDCPLPAK